jgi:hypothetical protein
MPQANEFWFPLFEFTDFLYRSFLVVPSDADPAGPVSLKDWTKGDFLCGQAFDVGDGYELGGTLVFRPGVELAVSVKGTKGKGDGPGIFEATGTGTTGPTTGAVYQLVGLIYPTQPIRSGAARIASIRGSVRAVQGPTSNPTLELGGSPIGTVGAFVIVSRGERS